nr:adenosylcobinamide-GDP ribazoletransferase [Sulfitobacter sp. THAF37]
MALGLLTRLPLPASGFAAHDTRAPAQAAWAYPLVGLVIGGAGVIAAALASGAGLPPAVAALITLAVTVLLTGAMHEDGLADCADGFWGGWTRDRRLEIMKDSQIGTYGVIALALTLILRWQLIALLIGAGALAAALIPAAMVSRACMVWAMQRLPHARNSGLSRQTGTPPRAAVIGALGIGVLAAAFSGAWLGVIVMSLAATLATGAVAGAKIGGQTGDVLGATQQIVECTVLMVVCAAALP